MIAHRKFHRAIFAIAGCYNLAWGIFTICDPQWLFRFARMPDANYPELFACLGMVIGVCGFLYWYVAYAPELGWPIAAVGLLGKILGPAGLAYFILSGRWAPRTMILCITNDLIWWAPFAVYLCDSWKLRVTRTNAVGVA
jgi:hypothetical protein